MLALPLFQKAKINVHKYELFYFVNMKLRYTRSEVLIALNRNTKVFWDWMLCIFNQSQWCI